MFPVMPNTPPTPPDADEELRPLEAAEILGVETSTLTNWADAGLIPVKRRLLANGERRFRRSDIEAAKARMEQSA